MGLRPITGPLVPSWVYQDYFPQADETKMASLAATWSQQAKSCRSQAEDLGARMSALADSYTGDAADAATESAHRTREWLGSTGDACDRMAKVVTRAAEYIAFTKRAINVVLAALQNATAKAKKESETNLVTKVIGMVKIRQLQIAAQAQIKALSTACADKVGGLTCDITIAPSMSKPSQKSIATYAVTTEDVSTHFPPGTSGGATNAAYPTGTQPGMPGPDGQTDTGAPMPPGMQDGATTPDGLPVDPAAIVGGGDRAADPNEPDPDDTDLTDTGLTDAENAALAGQAGQAMDDPNADFDYDADDLTQASTTVNPDAASDSLTNDGPVPPDATTGTNQSDDGASDGSLTPITADGDPDLTQQSPSGPDQSTNDDGWTQTSGPGHGPANGGAGRGHDNGYPTPGPPASTTPSPTPSSGNQQPPSQQPPASYQQPVAHQPPAPSYHDGPSPSGSSPTPSPSHGTAPVPHQGGSDPVSSTQPITHHPPGTTAAGVAPPVDSVPAPAPAPAGPSAPAPSAPAPSAPAPAPSAPMGGTNFGGGISGGAPPPAAAPPPLSAPSSGGAVTGAPPPGSAPPAASSPGVTPQGAAHAATSGAPSPRPQPAPVSTGTTGGGTPGGTGTAPPGSAPPGSAPPGAERSLPLPRRDIAVPDARTPLGGATQPAGDSFGALAMAGLVGGGVAASLILGDLSRPLSARATPSGGPHGGTWWVTQFGPADEATAVLPPGLGVVYEQVLLPGDTERLLTGRRDSVRGLLYPLDQVAHLTTPAQLHAALGLGYSLLDEHGSPQTALTADAPYLDVLRFNGIRDEDLVVPVEADVQPPDNAQIPWVVRHHQRPWAGNGEAPGSLSTAIIEEFELLAEAGVRIPHLAEIWRLHPDGAAEHVSTYNARVGVWTGEHVPAQGIGAIVPNGLHAQTQNGIPQPATAVNGHEHVLTSAPEPDDPEALARADPDGLCRRAVENRLLTEMLGVTTLAHWQGARVRLLRRDGDRSLIDYAGGDRLEAARLGLPQLGQAEWEARWVPAHEVSDRTRIQRPYPLPEPVPEFADAIS